MMKHSTKGKDSFYDSINHNEACKKMKREGKIYGIRINTVSINGSLLSTSAR